MKKTTTKIYALAFLLTLHAFTYAQGFTAKNNHNTFNGNWSVSPEAEKVFIENKGQFPKLNNAEVKYAYDGNGTKIYFSSTGLTYYFYERIVEKDEEKEREEREHKSQEKISPEEWIQKEREEHKIELKKDFVYLTWENANPKAEIIATDKVSDYYNYGGKVGNELGSINYVSAYKKLTYKNLYPNIDVEYIFHPTDGIKYSLILHPGADISMVKMSYSDTRKISITNEGDLQIKTSFGNIIDHAPISFYADHKSSTINSRFVKKGKIISFQLENYDNSKTLIIDPWTQTPTIANSNCVWECEKDGAGNIYIIGGDVPMKLLKYNATGTLQWTFVTAYDTAAHGNQNGDWLGTFATDLAGNSYVTCGSSASLTKVNSVGTQVYIVPGGSLDEYWNIAFNCDQTKLIIGGTRLTIPIKGYGTIFDVNTSNGSVNSTINVGYTSPGGFGITNADEVRSITSSRNAKYYYLTLDSLGAIDQNFSACPNASSLFKINDGLNLSYKCENYRPNNGNAGIMAIRANGNFVYTHNGTTIQKRSLSTGAILTSTVIPGGTSVTSLGTNQVGNSGIDIDSCGNIFVGSGNAVIMYDANLNKLSSATTAFKVYDVAVSYGGNVIATGATGTNSNTSRTGYVESFAMGACNPMVLFCCDATICPVGPFCNSAPSVTLSPVTAGGTWSGAGVNASGVFNPATAGPGVHTIIYTLPCGKDSIQITVNACATLSVCSTSNTLTVSGGTPSYTWSVYNPGGSTPITTQAQCTACNSSYTWFGGTCLNGFTPVTTCSTAPSWQQVGTGTTYASSGTFPIRVQDAAGNTYTITSLAAVPSCTPSACTTPTLSIVNTTSVTCFGASTGAATVSASPAGTYTYTWQPGNLNGASQSGLAAGIYTVSATSGACTGTVTVNITQPAAPLSASITAASPASCGQNNGSITVKASNGTPGYTYTWSPSGGNAATANNLAGGSYTVSVSDANSCTTTATASVSTTTNPSLTVNSETICAGQTTTLTVSGASTYTWTAQNPADLSSATGTTVTASPTTTAVYTVTGTAGTCSATTTSTITAISTPVITVNSATICAGSSATLTASGASTYTWNPATDLSSSSSATVTATPTTNASYTITGSLGTCTATPAIATVSVNSLPTLTLTPNAAAICKGDSAMLSISGATSYSWTPATGLSSSTATMVMASPANTTTYTVVGTTNNCSSTASVVVTVNPLPVFTVNSASICAGNSTILTASSNSTTPTYTWTPSTGLSATSGSVVTANPNSNQTYTITGALGTCTSVAIASVTVVPNPTVNVNSATICAGSATTLTASGASAYNWLPSTGLSSTTASVVTANPANTTTYTVIGSTSTCTTVATAVVTVNSLPTVNAGLDAAICKGDSAHLLATGADTYVWTPAAGLNNSNIANPTASPNTTTNYTVVGTNTVTGCTKADVVTVTTSTLHATLSANPVNGDAPLTVTFGANTGAGTYYWNYGNGTFLSAGDTTQTIYPNPGTYTASVVETSAAGCKDSASIIIIVTEGYSIVIPNIITPNGDNTNDYFFIKHEGISALEMVIYDRWGLQMWQSSSLNGAWDGKYNGKEVPEGVYFYLIKATPSRGGATKEYQGYITLIK